MQNKDQKHCRISVLTIFAPFDSSHSIIFYHLGVLCQELNQPPRVNMQIRNPQSP